jgi:zinc ribbon protein
MAFCAKCGNQLSDAAAFCTKCGTAKTPAAPVSAGTAKSSTVSCRTCGKEVAYRAWKCVHCGQLAPAEGSPRAKKIAKGIFIGVGSLLGLIILIAVFSPSDDQKKGQGVSAASATADDSVKPRIIVGDNHLGCENRDYFAKLISYAAEKDTRAFQAAFEDGLINGDCTSFKRGEPVFVEETSILGVVKVRRQGQTQEFWTNTEAIADK